MKKANEQSEIDQSPFPAGRLEYDSAVPLYHQLKELIKDQIARQVWRMDEMIPSENELAAAYNISPGTVKKAFAELVHEGVLYRRQGKGTFVARPNFKRSFIRFFRYGLGEGQVGKLPTSRIISSRVIIPPARIKEILRLEKKARVIAIRRLRTLEDIPLMMEDLYLPEEIFHGFEKLDISKELLYPIFDAEYHTPISWAEEFLEPRIADEQVARDLGIKKGDAVIFVERIAYTLGDRPVEFRVSIGRGDRFRYHVEIR